MKSIIISAFACDPTQGSEPGNGWSWAGGIAQRGYFVHLITTSRSKNSIENELITLPYKDRIKVHYINHSKFWAKAYYWNFITMYLAYWLWQKKIYKYIVKNIDTNKVDFIHHVTWGSLKIGTQLYKLRKPLLFGPVGGGQLTPLNYKEYLGDDYWKEKLRNILGKIVIKYNPFSKGVLKNAQILVTNMDTLKLVSSLSKNQPVLVFDAAINESLLQTILKRNNRQNQKVTFLWVGRIFGFKGLRLIIEAISLLDKTYTDKLELIIVGDGPDKENISKLVKLYNIDKQVKFIGMIPYEQVKGYYELSDVFIYTSLRDSFPGQILEAQLFGLPVITLDLHGQSLMINQENGYKITVNKPETTVKQIKEVIMEMIDNPVKRTQLGEASHKHAIQQTWDKKIDKIVSDFYPKQN